jgi:hypothetical protein
MLHAATPALRNASSKLESLSRCFPTPFVRNILVATNAISVPGFGSSARESRKFFSESKSSKKVHECQRNLNLLAK